MIGRNSFLRVGRLIRKWEGALWLAGAIGVVLIGGILSWWFWDELGSDTESFSTTLRQCRPCDRRSGGHTARRVAQQGLGASDYHCPTPSRNRATSGRNCPS